MPRLLNTEAQREIARAYSRKWAKTPAGKRKKKRDDRKHFLRYKELIYIRMREFYNKRKNFVDRLKNRPCMDCGGWFEPYQMDWDHRDPELKIGNVGGMRQGRLDKLIKEIKKCDLVCSNCHRARTWSRGQHDSRAHSTGYINRHLVPKYSTTNKEYMHGQTSL